MKKYLPIILIIFTAISCHKTPKKQTVKEQKQEYIEWSEIYNKEVKAAQGWKYIIIHHSACNYGNAKLFHKWHTDKGFGGLAYHFVIGNGHGSGNGQVEYGFRWKQNKIGTHVTVDAWYHNVFGIGICLVGNFDYARPTWKQLTALIKLIRKLAKRYNIPKKNVVGHKDVPHGRLITKGGKIIFKRTTGYEKGHTTCPGKYFPMAYVKRMAFRKTRLP